MKRKLKINAKAQIVYLPKDLVENGWNADADAYVDDYTITIVKPETSLERVKESISLVGKYIDIRIKEEHAEKVLQ